MRKALQLTKAGLQALMDELNNLRDVKRPQLIDRLSNARSQGDLSENSDYQNSKEELEFLDGRVAELENIIKTATVVDESGTTKSGGIAVGTKVTVKLNGKQVVFEIVGDWEADPLNRKISHTSPLGSALTGKKAGDKVEVEAPAGKIMYEILSVD